MNNTILLACLSLLFGLFCIGRELRTIAQARQIRISNLFLIMYGVIYGIVLSLFLFMGKDNIYRQTAGSFIMFDYSERGIANAGWWFLSAVVGYFAFRFTCSLRFRQRKARPETSLAWASFENALLLERLQLTAIICFLIGLVSFLIWAHGWGGYRNLFINAAAIRNGSYGVRNTVAFFAKPAQILSMTTIIFLFLVRRRKNFELNLILFAISFGCALLYFLAKDGRLMMGTFFLIVLFMWNGTFEKQLVVGKKLASLLIFFGFFLFVVLNMNDITAFIRHKTEFAAARESTLDTIMHELAFIYSAGQSSVHLHNTQGCSWMIGHDVGYALFAWLPSAFTPRGLINLWDYNTYMIAGDRAMAQYPTDLISASIYDLGVAGPVLLPALWGFIIRKVDQLGEYQTPLCVVLYYALSITMIRAVPYSMMHSTVTAMFHIFVTAAVFWFVCGVKRA